MRSWGQVALVFLSVPLGVTAWTLYFGPLFTDSGRFSKYPLRESSQGVSRSQAVRISENCWTVTENAAYHTGSLRKWRKRERSEELNNDQQLPTMNETEHDRFKGLENAFWIFWRDRHTYAYSNFKSLKDKEDHFDVNQRRGDLAYWGTKK